VVAVNDVGCHPFNSWISHDTGNMWLKDFLSNDITGIRIMIYGCQYGGETTDIDFLTHRKHFLQTLANGRQTVPVCILPHSVRESPRRLIDTLRNQKKRPIIFIGHGVGGTLILQVVSGIVKTRCRIEWTFVYTSINWLKDLEGIENPLSELMYVYHRRSYNPNKKEETTTFSTQHEQSSSSEFLMKVTMSKISLRGFRIHPEVAHHLANGLLRSWKNSRTY
jgi:hypothetical protein